MRALVIIVSMVFMMSASSCVQLPDLNPNSNDNMVVTEVEINGFFSMYQQFSKPIDVNGNGTIDFYFNGRHTHDDMYGTLYSVTLEGARSENKVIAKSLTENYLCTGNLPNKPVYPLKANLTVGPYSQWFRNVSFYDYQFAPNGCEDFMWHIPMDTGDWNEYTHKDKFFGVRFREGDHTYYGWVKMNVWNQSFAGFPQSPDVYRIKQLAYNANAGGGVRIPAE